MNICEIKDCSREICAKGICNMHYIRYRRHKSFEKLTSYGPKGGRNINWKGGIAEYPNHYLMKKNRLIILLNNLKCEKCGKPATEVHHRDGSKINHKLSNLMASCHRCNSAIRFKPNNSKYRRRYGMNLLDITDKIGRSISYWSMHQKELDTILLDKMTRICYR